MYGWYPKYFKLIPTKLIIILFSFFIIGYYIMSMKKKIIFDNLSFFFYFLPNISLHFHSLPGKLPESTTFYLIKKC